MTHNPREGMDHPPAMTQLQKDFRRLQRERAARMRTLPEDMPDFVPEGQDAPATHPAWAEKYGIEPAPDIDSKRKPPAPRGYFNCFCGNMHKLEVLGRATDHKDDRPPEPEKIDLGDPTERRRSATLEVPTLPELGAALTWLANEQGNRPDYYTEDLDEWYRRLTKEN